MYFAMIETNGRTVLAHDTGNAIKQFATAEDAKQMLRNLWPVTKKMASRMGVVDAASHNVDIVWERKTIETPKANTPADASPHAVDHVPGGYYAVDDKRYHVSTPSKGKWKGWTFLATGSDYHSRKTIAMVRPNGTFTARTSDHGKAVYNVIAKDPREAMAAYGKITGTCGKCGRKLEDEESRARGIGPVCAGKM